MFSRNRIGEYVYKCSLNENGREFFRSGTFNRAISITAPRQDWVMSLNLKTIQAVTKLIVKGPFHKHLMCKNACTGPYALAVFNIDALSRTIPYSDDQTLYRVIRSGPM